MKKDVIISIRGRQFYDGEQDEPVEFVTDGRFYKRNGRYYISYRESELTGFGKTVTTLKVEPGKVTLSRAGECPSRFVFEKGRRHVAMYSLKEGSLTMAFTTRLLRSALTDEGGSVEVGYSFDLDGEYTGGNVFKVQIEEALPEPGAGREDLM